MQANIYYIVLFTFGLLLIAFVAISWFRTKSLISEQKSSSAELVGSVSSKIAQKITLWRYYFVAGEPKNLLRNILFSIIVFMVLYFVNIAYIKLNAKLFVLLFIVAFIYLIWKLGQRRNRKMFENTFPEILQVINSATSSGGGLLQALERCGKDVDGLLGDEFRMIYRRLSIGEDPVAVFEDSYTRYPYKEYYFFIMAIRLNLSKGGQIREVMARLSRVIADSKKMEQKKKAMTSEARMSAMIVACFPIGFFFFMQWTMPENFDFIINDPSGRIILYYVFGSEALGMFIIWLLMRRST